MISWQYNAKPNTVRARQRNMPSADFFVRNKLQGILALTLIIVSVVYLVQVNTLATKGYAMKGLEKQISLQKKDNSKLQMEIVQAGSLAQTQKKINSLHLVRAGTIEYLTLQNQPVAIR